MKHLIKDAYDLHIHPGPDLLPRKMDDIEMAQRIIAAGMAGYAMKSHFFCTAERAYLINKMFPGCDAIGGLCLNNAVGGINPAAVDFAGRSGAKIIWMPTTDSAHEQELVFGGNHEKKKFPYWATLIIQLREEGIKLPELTVLDENDKLTKATIEVLDIIAKQNLILATGHLSQHEVFILVKEAQRRGVKNIIITHADYPGTYYNIEQQKELASYGATLEHCFTTWFTEKVSFEEATEQIRAVGPDHCIISTDLGQKKNCYPDEGLLEFATRLHAAGVSEADLRKLLVTNPRRLLGK